MPLSDPPAPLSSPSATGDADSPDPAQGQNRYYLPDYFTPFYFYGGSALTTSPESLQILGRDGGCYATLVAMVEALGLFDSVIFGDPTSQSVPGASTHPLAIVTPRGWEETDETDPIVWVRRVLFTIRVVIRVDAGTAPFVQLDRLATAVEAQVNQVDLGDQCIPALTKIRAGRYTTSSQYPEWSIDLDGEFTVLDDPEEDLVDLI